MQNTPCQDKAIQFIKEFLLDPNQNECIISGQGGVGKTYVMNQVCPIIEELTQVLDTINEKFQYDQVLRCATTNKAASLVEGSTLESTFGYRIVNNFKTGKKNLMRNDKNPKQYFRTVFCIDEASMLGSKLRDMYMQDTKECKFIYFMDSAQAVPVNSGGMAVLELSLPEVEMITPVRQSDASHLYEQCCKLRQAVFDQQTHFPEVGPDIQYVTKAALEKYIKAADGLNHKILTYTNKLASLFNQGNRIANGRTKPYEEGELLISNSAHSRGNKTLLSNESLCTVISCTYDGRSYHGVEFCELTVALMSGKHISISAPVDSELRHKVQKELFRKKDYKAAFELSDDLADLRNAAASTIHKSQGSTFETVLIHVNDLMKLANYDQDTYRRLLFVAVSRAKRKVYLYDEFNS